MPLGHPPLGPQLAAISIGQIVSILLMLGGIVLLAWALRRQSARPKQADDAQRIDDLQRLMAEATELVDELSARLDAKAERVQQLLDEADARLDLPAAAQAAEPDYPAEPADPLMQRIFDLADEGLSPVQIAQRLDQHTGKVQLILALRSQ
ncbi:MAG: hypothetical protein ACKVW3_06115 [Phycisphaerales bacterium]